MELMKYKTKDFIEESNGKQRCMLCGKRLKKGVKGLAVSNNTSASSYFKQSNTVKDDLICEVCLIELISHINSEFLSSEAKALLVVKSL